MSKRTLYFVNLILIAFLFILIKPIRTENSMLAIANDEFQSISIYDSLRQQLKGPIIYNKGCYREYKWYKKLDWESSESAVFIDVYKYPISFSWRDNFFYPKITMNYQWYYFVFPNGTSKISDLLGNKKNVNIDSLKFKLVKNNFNLIINQELIFYFLKKGFFSINHKNKDFTYIDFYEPIASVFYLDNQLNKTLTAKVYVKDSIFFVEPILEYPK